MKNSDTFELGKSIDAKNRITQQEKNTMKERIVDIDKANTLSKKERVAIMTEWRDHLYVDLKPHAKEMESALRATNNSEAIGAYDAYIEKYSSSWNYSNGRNHIIALYQSLLYARADKNTQKRLGKYGECGCGVDGILGVKTLATSGQVMKQGFIKGFDGLVPYGSTAWNYLITGISTSNPDSTSTSNPDSTSTSNPDSTSTSNPDSTSTSNPDSTSTSNPDSTSTSNPDSTSTSNPDSTSTSNPDSTSTSNPDSTSTSNPDSTSTSNPDSTSTSNPDSTSTSNPDSTSTSNPDSTSTSNPDSTSTSNPDSTSTSNPNPNPDSTSEEVELNSKTMRETVINGIKDNGNSTRAEYKVGEEYIFVTVNTTANGNPIYSFVDDFGDLQPLQVRSNKFRLNDIAYTIIQSENGIYIINKLSDN